MALCRRLCVIELVRDLDRSNFVRSYPPVWNWACDVISTPMETAHCFSTIRPTPSSYSRSSSQPASHSSVRGIHVSCSNLSSRRGRLSTLEDFHRFVASLNSSEVKTLETVLKEQRGIEGQKEAESDAVEAPSWKQLKRLCYRHALPFIGFGFLDNSIMISVGEYIDWTIGLTLGISTMAAAGLGNMISDLAGIGLADQVEAACRALGIPNPQLTAAQMNHSSTRWMALLGRCIGIVIGCAIGMCPLLWLKGPHKPTKETVDN